MKVCLTCCDIKHNPEAKFCMNCGAELFEQTKPIITTYYLHSNKDSNYEKGEELGLDGDALVEFAYTCYEVGFKMEINPQTGKAKIVGMYDKNKDLVLLETPIEV